MIRSGLRSPRWQRAARRRWPPQRAAGSANRGHAEASSPGAVLPGIGVRFVVMAGSSDRLRSPAAEHALEGIPKRREQQGQQEPGPRQCNHDRARPETGADIGLRGLCDAQRQHRDSAARNQRGQVKLPAHGPCSMQADVHGSIFRQRPGGHNLRPSGSGQAVKPRRSGGPAGGPAPGDVYAAPAKRPPRSIESCRSMPNVNESHSPADRNPRRRQANARPLHRTPRPGSGSTLLGTLVRRTPG